MKKKINLKDLLKEQAELWDKYSEALCEFENYISSHGFEKKRFPEYPFFPDDSDDPDDEDNIWTLWIKKTKTRGECYRTKDYEYFKGDHSIKTYDDYDAANIVMFKQRKLKPGSDILLQTGELVTFIESLEEEDKVKVKFKDESIKELNYDQLEGSIDKQELLKRFL
jgi:hypothetical protein